MYMSSILDEILILWIVNAVLAVIVLFFQRKDPKAICAWLLLLYAIPVLGFVVYLMAGAGIRHRRRGFAIVECQSPSSTDEQAQIESGRFGGLVSYNQKYGCAALTVENELTIYSNGQEKFAALIKDLLAAKESVDFQYYMIRNDVLFQRIKEVLVQKAGEGVRVRVLFDGMGCRSTRGGVWRELEKAGVCTAEYDPAFLRRFQLRPNYRNHRKNVVIDGQIGYVGGFNIGREYVGLSGRFGAWRDTHLCFRGAAAAELERLFLGDWERAKQCPCGGKKWRIANHGKNSNGLMDHIAVHKGMTGLKKVPVQIIASGPDGNCQIIRDNYLYLISRAKHSVFIQTPYFIPDEAVLAALLLALRSGVGVYLMIPGGPDHMFVYPATLSYMGELVMAGAKCYRYRKGFLHAKGLLVDGEVFCYGTANMDIRSFSLNFEVNAVVYSAVEAKKMEALFWEDTKDSVEVTKELYVNRPLIIKIKEQFCRLFSPIL